MFKKIIELTDKNKESLTDIISNEVFPIIKVSNLTGMNIDLLKSYLKDLKLNEKYTSKLEENTKMIIEDIYQVKGVGLVLSGTVNSGKIVKGGEYMLGPFDGVFGRVLVKSIHDNFCNFVDEIPSGSSGCYNIKSLNRKFVLKKNSLKRGMMLIDLNDSKNTYMEFEAKVKILHHPTTIKKNYETMIHCGTIKQVAKIIS